jgi:hypothetical protein
MRQKQMRFSVILAVAMMGLNMTAAAQKFDKPKTKPSHSEEKESNKKSRTVAKEPANKNSSAQELRRVEQSGARSSAARKSETGKAARTNPALKAQKKESNPPIHFASSSGSKGGKRKAGDPYKGRLRHKGSH